MKSDSASILLNLIIEKSVNGLSAKDQSVLEELIASAPDPAQAARNLRQCEAALADKDFTNLPESMGQMVRERLHAARSRKPQDHEMPNFLRRAIIADGLAYVEKTYGSGRSKRANNKPLREFRPRGVPIGRRSPLKRATSIARVAAIQIRRFGDSVSRIPKVREVGTLIVAAAGLLAVALFLRQQPEPAQNAKASKFATAESEASSLILMDEQSVNRHQRQTFLANPPVDILRVACKTQSGNENVGELLWSDSQQKGFVSLSAMEVNDPNQFQYQVWIVDSNQKYPINAGVFDMVDQNRVDVRLRPNIKITKAIEFVVTKERPGGVVASKRKNIVAVAKIKKK